MTSFGDSRWRRVAAGLALAAPLVGLSPSLAWAQSSDEGTPFDEGFAVGDWTFFPTLELRLRSEYRRNPVTTGGDVYDGEAVQLDGVDAAGAGQQVPLVLRRDPAVDNQWLIAERARLGMRVEWDVIRAQLTLQDARIWGTLPGAPSNVDAGGMGVIEPYEAYLDVRSNVEDPWLWVRAGRQRLRWGDGRLLGDDDWGARAAPFDAARVHLTAGDFDLELLAAMLAFPGAIPPRLATDERRVAVDDDGQPVNAEGTGAQLYGLQASYRVFPLLAFEATAIARVVRDPHGLRLTNGDTYTVGGRIFGEERGVDYAVEGAYQLGRVAGYGVLRDLSAFALAARVAWQTALPWDFRFAARGAYASGDSDPTSSDLGRFDPILPTTHEHHGMMDLYSWSNLIEAGANVSARPHEMVLVDVGYSFVGLAQPGDRWSTANLLPVGADPNNDSRILGHEVDARIEVRPWEPLGFSGGYGAMILGDGGKAILAAAGRPADLLHFGYLQAELRVP
ncbi:MAG: alginate export family protein [Myxococcales bacterium]|nr:alginate export family protein [Myxococcales bacterium]